MTKGLHPQWKYQLTFSSGPTYLIIFCLCILFWHIHLLLFICSSWHCWFLGVIWPYNSLRERPVIWEDSYQVLAHVFPWERWRQRNSRAENLFWTSVALLQARESWQSSDNFSCLWSHGKSSSAWSEKHFKALSKLW